MINRIIYVISIICGLALIGAIGSSYIPPTVSIVFSIVGLLFPIIVLVNIILFVLLLFNYKSNKKLLIIVFWLLIVAMYLSSKDYRLYNSKVETGDLKAISVMSFNIRSCNNFYDKKWRFRQDKLDDMEYLLNEKMSNHVLSFQEASKGLNHIMSKYPEYKYHHFSLKKRTRIYSKFPIVNRGEIDFGQTGNSCIWADINFQGTIVRFYDFHLQSNLISAIDVENITNHNENIFKSLWISLKKYGKSSIVRLNQARKLKAHSIDSQLPFIMMGDMNDTSLSFVYKELTQGLTDAFVEVGLGIGATFHFFSPWLRIDYLLGSKQIVFTEYHRDINNLSDHYPVMAKFVLKNNEVK